MIYLFHTRLNFGCLFPSVLLYFVLYRMYRIFFRNCRILCACFKKRMKKGDIIYDIVIGFRCRRVSCNSILSDDASCCSTSSLRPTCKTLRGTTRSIIKSLPTIALNSLNFISKSITVNFGSSWDIQNSLNVWKR